MESSKEAIRLNLTFETQSEEGDVGTTIQTMTPEAPLPLEAIGGRHRTRKNRKNVGSPELKLSKTDLDSRCGLYSGRFQGSFSDPTRQEVMNTRQIC